MKYALHNFEFFPEDQLQIPVSNRAFQYNDGAFETMLFTNGKVRFLESHLSRLQKAAKVLQITLPQTLLEPETVAFYLEKLIAKNQLSGNIR
ncbi:MAG TPA: aminotransferase class IV, partial [Adhaeribacter sp.]|nr:aminotransferase class IV [Adhaeribacter sp.]